MTQSQEIALILTTVDSPTRATDLANTILSERLAACVSQSSIHSTYHWKGVLEHSTEIQLLIKTTPARVKDLASRLRAIHPYETPEILIMPTVETSEAYAAWVIKSTN